MDSVQYTTYVASGAPRAPNNAHQPITQKDCEIYLLIIGDEGVQSGWGIPQESSGTCTHGVGDGGKVIATLGGGEGEVIASLGG